MSHGFRLVLTMMQTGFRVIELGRVTSIERDHKPIDNVRPGGQSVAIKIEQTADQSYVMYGRHFDEKNSLYSRVSYRAALDACIHFVCCLQITRGSIDILKENFRDEMLIDDWHTVIKLKGLLKVD